MEGGKHEGERQAEQMRDHRAPRAAVACHHDRVGILAQNAVVFTLEEPVTPPVSRVGIDMKKK